MLAEKTKVPADKSAADIKKALANFGAKSFSLDTRKDYAQISFIYEDMPVKFRFTTPENPGRTATIAQKKKYEQATNVRWRQLLICLKAKLESVSAGLETFEQAFMGHMSKFSNKGGEIRNQVKKKSVEKRKLSKAA